MKELCPGGVTFRWKEFEPSSYSSLQYPGHCTYAPYGLLLLVAFVYGTPAHVLDPTDPNTWAPEFSARFAVYSFAQQVLLFAASKIRNFKSDVFTNWIEAARSPVIG